MLLARGLHLCRFSGELPEFFTSRTPQCTQQLLGTWQLRHRVVRRRGKPARHSLRKARSCPPGVFLTTPKWGVLEGMVERAQSRAPGVLPSCTLDWTGPAQALSRTGRVAAVRHFELSGLYNVRGFYCLLFSLQLCPLRTPAAVLVESKLSSRALRLDTLRPSLPALTSGGGGDLARKGPSLSAGADHSRTLLKLTRTKAKASGLFDIRRELCGSRQADRRPRSSSLSPPALRSTASRSRDSLSRLRFDELHGLRRLWLQYTENVCGTREASAPVSLKQAISPAAALPRKPPSGVVSETSGRATGETVAESSAEQAQADPSSRQKQPGNGNGRKQRAYDRCTILSKCALQGAQVAVVRARVPGLVGIEGTVVEETQQVRDTYHRRHALRYGSSDLSTSQCLIRHVALRCS